MSVKCTICFEHFKSQKDVLQHEVVKHLVIYCPFCHNGKQTKFVGKYLLITESFESHVRNEHQFVKHAEMRETYGRIVKYILTKELCGECEEYCDVANFNSKEKMCQPCCELKNGTPDMTMDELISSCTQLSVSQYNNDTVGDLISSYANMDINKLHLAKPKLQPAPITKPLVTKPVVDSYDDELDDDIVSELTSQYSKKMSI